MARLGWFLAGAATGVAVLVAAPHSYERLRALVEVPGYDAEPPADQPGTDSSDYSPATAFAGYDAPPAEGVHVEDDTAELRLRIDETRERIRRRAEDAAAADEA